MEDTNKPISDMSSEEFQKLQLDVANGKDSHFKEVEKDSEENKNTEEIIPESDSKDDIEKKPESENQKKVDEEGGKEDQDKEKDEGKEEPPTRKSKKDYIINRLQKRKEKLQKKEEDSEEYSEDEDEMIPSDRKAFKKVIDEEVGAKVEELEKMKIEEEEEKELVRDMKEVDEFVSKNEQFKPYRDKILKWWQHPTRKNLPLKAVAYEIAGDDLIMLGAERERKANENAFGSSTGSDSATVTFSKKVSEMTDKEFEEYQTKVLYGK